jgi:hypothetical protein
MTTTFEPGASLVWVGTIFVTDTLAGTWMVRLAPLYCTVSVLPAFPLMVPFVICGAVAVPFVICEPLTVPLVIVLGVPPELALCCIG